jgi:vancomycin resistance protein VanJ
VEEPTPQASPSSNSAIQKGLSRLGGHLQTENGRKTLIEGCLNLLRRLLRWSILVYLVALFLTLLLMKVVGERNLFFAFCLYLPPLIWYLPLFALMPICLMAWEWRSLLLGIVGAGITVTMFLGFKSNHPLPIPARDDASTLVILTNNRGQHGNASMRPFKNAVMPDVMAFQEQSGLAARYLADPNYSEFKHGRDLDEFTLLSRYPIESVSPLFANVRKEGSDPSTAGQSESVMIAARFEIDFRGQRIVIYNVHIPTPRGTLQYNMRGAFLYGLIGIPGTALGRKREINQQSWNQRITMIKQLIESASKESNPTLLAGDFNMPSLGYCHGLMSDHYTDAHDAAGSGFGFSFPGTTHNPLALGRPWMRIDYLFADPKNWTCLAAVTEPERPSQHRAVAAVYSIKR